MINEKIRVALSSILAAVFLTGTKFVVGILTGSLGLLSEALHSCLDLFAAIITLYTVSVSDKPADENHHFGHGKIENISALIQTVLLFITRGWILYEAIGRLLSGNTHIDVNVWSYVVIVLSIVIDISRSRALARTAKKYNSQALEADALHFSTDIWSSGVVLIGLACANFGWYLSDSIAALIVAMIVLYVSYQLAKKSIHVLTDKTSHDSYNLIKKVVGSYNEIISYNALRLRTSGADTFIDIDIVVDSSLNVEQAHAISHKLEAQIHEVLDRSFVHIHIEPNSKQINL